MTARNPSDSFSPEAKSDLSRSIAAAFSVLLLLALVVIIGVNFIPYYVAASWLIRRVPGMEEFLIDASAVVFPVAIAAIGASVYYFTRGVIKASNNPKLSKKGSKYLPAVAAFLVVALCVLSKASTNFIFIAAIGSIAAFFILLIQFRWILFQHDRTRVSKSINHEQQVGEVEDSDLAVASRSERQILKGQANAALVADCLVSLYVYPPLVWSMLLIVLTTGDFSAVDLGNVAMIALTTILPGVLLRMHLRLKDG